MVGKTIKEASPFKTKVIKNKSSKTTAKAKTIKKAPAKKDAAKKVAKKASAKKKAAPKKNSMNRRISPEQYFYLKDGAILKSINDLAKMMDKFEDEVFNHHVNDERHDFANWIEEVFDEADLARQLVESEKDKQKNHYIILKYVFKNR